MGTTTCLKMKQKFQAAKKMFQAQTKNQTLEVSFHPSRVQQVIPNMFMPYKEGPKMDWTVNDSLYNRFLKWHLKCEKNLECELAALPEWQKCKNLIACSGDLGMDQYVSWCLSAEELNLETITG